MGRVGIAVLTLCAACRIGFDPFEPAGDGLPPGSDGCSTCEQGLVAHYKLDESDGTAVAERTAMRDGTTQGNTAWAPASGLYGGALELLGNGYVRADWAAEQLLTTQATTAAWVNLDPSSPDEARFMSTYYWNGTSNGVFEMDAGKTGLVCKFFVGGTWRNLFTDGAPARGEWHHLACVYDGTAVIGYLDGIELKRTAASGTIGASEPLPYAIGASIFPDGTAQNRMIGLIDEVRVYDRALTPTELAQLATPP